jgi:predicted TIM-barrel fold metal-dependent hydrolase
MNDPVRSRVLFVMKKSALEAPHRSPVYFGPISNGEFLPLEIRARDRAANRWVHEVSEVQRRRLGIDRRDFLVSPMATVAALLALNHLHGCRTYQVTDDMLDDRDAARAAIGGVDFIFDCQTHHLDGSPGATWIAENPKYHALFSGVAEKRECGRKEPLACLARDVYFHEIFAASDTDIALLSGVPALRRQNPLDNSEIAHTRDLLDQHGGQGRLMAQGVVYPNGGPNALDDLQSLEEEMRIVGWKVYTPWGPNGVGFWLDDGEVGLPFLDRVRKSRTKIVFCHKGIPWPIWDKEFASPRDIGPAARQYPDLRFVVYHSGYEPDVVEGPFDENGQGIDRLLVTCRDNGIGAGGNVYAELGGTWAILLRRPVEAAHALGKLLKYFGEDRILWGTDALFVGTPQPQIDAFRAFQIPVELQERHGYPALTAERRAKILGLNAAHLFGVEPRRLRHQIREGSARAIPVRPEGYGPHTRREFYAFLRGRGGKP